MRSTRAAQSLKNLFAGYHEPLPLSKQQSEKLLDGLKLSFRQQLDQEYGHGPSSLQSSPAPTSSSTVPPTEGEQRPITRESAAKQHLKAILLNPLFSYEKDISSPLPHPKPTPNRDPMDVFDHAVSRGMMTSEAATGCLLAKHNLLQMYPDAVARASGSGTALRVIRWLRSSRPESDLDFLSNRRFIDALMPFLVSEGLDHVAWEWVARTVNDSSNTVSNHERRRRATYLLNQHVRVKSLPQHGDLNAAMSTLLQAAEVLRSSPLLSRILTTPWRSVSWLSTVESYSRSRPSEALFNAHLNTANRLSEPLEVETAHLHLYHPTHSDHAPALRIFHDTEKLHRLIYGITPEKLSTAKSKDPRISRWITALGHDTVNYLTKAGRVQEAESVKESLQSETTGLFSHTLNPAAPHGAT